MRSLNNSEHINEKGDGSYHGFGYLSLVSDPLDLSHGAKEDNCNFVIFNRVVDPNLVKYIKCRLENVSKPIIIF